jgi:hypothetical protein
MTLASTPPPSPECVPLPSLSDEAAVEIYLFIEHLFLLMDSRYGDQIRRHYDNLSHDSLIHSGGILNLDDPPF